MKKACYNCAFVDVEPGIADGNDLPLVCSKLIDGVRVYNEEFDWHELTRGFATVIVDPDFYCAKFEQKGKPR
jgi:hypothetical protein